MRSLLLKLSGFSAIVLFAVFSCTKIDETDIGLGLIPPVDNIHTFDTLIDVITTSSDLPDSTRLLVSEDHLFGMVTGDPGFGNDEARSYFELKPAFFGAKPFIDTLVGFDSAVLSLSIKGFYGDTNTAQLVKVNELDAPGLPKKYDTSSAQNMVIDSAFLIRDQRPVMGTFIASPKMVFPNRLKDTTTIFYAKQQLKVTNVIRFRLDPTFAQRLFSAPVSDYISDTTFRNMFKGFAVNVDQGMGGKGFFNLDVSSINTAIQFYYRIRKNNVLDTVVTNFTLTNRCGHAMYYNWDKTGSRYGNFVPSGSPAGDSILFLKTVPGTYATIKIPGLSSVSNRVVHRAELVVKQLPGSTPPFNTFIQPPGGIHLECIDTLPLNKFVVIPHDFGVTSSGPNFFYFGGYRPTYPTTIDGFGNNIYNYTFNLTGYVQGVITRHERNYDLRMYAPYEAFLVLPGYYTFFTYNSIAQGRVIVAGGTHSGQPMKLRIIYSKL